MENIKAKWIPEIQAHSPNTPFILVGTKLDLREDANVECVSKAEGEALREELKGAKYIECSARTQENLKPVFDAAIQIVLNL